MTTPTPTLTHGPAPAATPDHRSAAGGESSMSITVSLEGDDVRVPTRMILAPEAGTFRPSPPETCTTEGEIVAPGTSVGTVESLGRVIDIRSAFHGFLMGMMALPGERVRAGQPVAWLHAIGGES